MKNKFLAVGLTLALGGTMALSGCGTNKVNATVTTEVSSTPIPIVAEQVLAYMQAETDVPISTLQQEWGYSRSHRLDMGIPVTIDYTFETESDVDILLGYADVYEKGSKTRFTRVELDPYEDSVSIYNLKADAEYTYTLTVRLTNKQSITSEGSFKTAKSPRFMYVDGASNVRDVGGWNSSLGGKIKQGVLYRGSEIDGKKNTGIAGFTISEAGVTTMLSVMKIKSDFDLRDASALGINPTSAGILGSEVKRTFLPSAYYEQILNQPETLKTVFSAFADESAYPVYLHCTHGVDRAGTISLVLEALLGVEKADLIRDYELSNYFYTNVDRYYDENGGDILTLISKLENDYEGETLADKTADMLIKAGVTAEQISLIRSIFLEN
ncbi:MAG: tyrosine-protein phosphatase [Clostridia bacterium]|nr:tyrosine-protein phosphatase [Clostridia bacterium]